MAINLWKAGGKPTSYSPLPTGYSNTVAVSDTNKDYVVTFKAKSPSNAKLRFQGALSAGAPVFDLTSESKVYSGVFRPNGGTNLLYLYDMNSIGDIIIDSIELVQKPLSKLTINGIDGFKSGKWTLHANASVVDDETLELNATADWSASRLDVPVLPNTTYTLTREVISGVMYIDSYDKNNVKISNLVATSLLNSTFTTPSNCSYVKVLFDNGTGRGTFTFKRPMLNLGAIPLPTYSKKTGDKMVMPVALKNILGASDVKRADCQTIHANVTDVLGINGFQNGLRFPNNSATIYAYQSNVLLDKTKTYTFSCYVKMDDNSAPILNGALATIDISIVIGGNAVSASNTYVESIGNGVYRVSANLLNTNMLNTNVGVVKYSNNSPKGFTISGWQLEEGTTPTPYKPYAVQVNAKPKRYVPKKNLISALESGTITGTGTLSAINTVCRTSLIPIKPNTNYTAQRFDSDLTASNVVIYFYDGVGTYISNTGGVKSVTATSPSNATQARVRFLAVNDVDIPNFKPQLEEGTTQTTYEPYQLILPRAKTGLSYEGQYSYLQLPSMTMDSIEIDCLIDSVQPNTFPKIVDARTGLVNGNYGFNGSAEDKGTGWSTATGLKRGERTKIKVNAFNPFTDDVTIFAKNDGTDKLKGTLYKVTCYLAGTIVAQYDFENPSNIVGDKVLSIADNVTAGKNKFDGLLEQNTINSSGVPADFSNSFRSVNFMDVTGSKQYYMSSNRATGLRVFYYDSSKVFISFLDIGSGGAFTTPSNAKYIKFRNYPSDGTLDYLIQIEEGSAATTYEPYQLITIKRDTKNLIPSFDDARWSLHANTQVLGKDYLRLNATAANQHSYINLPTNAGNKYRLNVDSRAASWFEVLNSSGTVIQSGYGNLQLREFTVISGGVSMYIGFSNFSIGTGTFDFIKPSLYQLDSKEGTIVGSPAKLNKASKRSLYNKR